MNGLAQIIEENNRLKKVLAQKEEEFAQLQEESSQKIELLIEENSHLAQELAFLQEKNKRPASQRYISYPPAQKQLDFGPEYQLPTEAVEEPAETDEPTDTGESETTERSQKETKSKNKRKKNRKKKKSPSLRRTSKDFPNLEGKSVFCPALKASCSSCGQKMHVTGTSNSTRIEWVPGHFVVLNIKKEKITCSHCENSGVFTAQGNFFLPRSLAGNGLLARIVVDKFADHIPAHRQARRMKREGFEVGSNTLSRWLLQAGEGLELLAKEVNNQIIQNATVLQGDDTGMPVQDGGNGKLRKGRMWAFTDRKQVAYHFTASKEGKFPLELVGDFQGDYLVVDGGSEFNELLRRSDFKRAGCWAHARKYFFEAVKTNPTAANVILVLIQKLFAIERKIQRQQPTDILAERKKLSQPIVNDIFNLTTAWKHSVRPKSRLGKAITYINNQEERLRVFLECGEIPIHNNLSELMLRQPVVGRKNWLFARSEGGAKVAATMYTLIGSCKLQGIDPMMYLNDVFGRLLDHPRKRIGELTPLNWNPKD